MNTLTACFVASMLAVATPAIADHQHHGGAAPEAKSQAQALAEIDPTAESRGGCGKCKQKGMGGMHGGGHEGHGGGHEGHGGGMGGCTCKKGGMGGGHGDGGCPKAAALEDRIDELEKRLDVLQLLLMRSYR